MVQVKFNSNNSILIIEIEDMAEKYVHTDSRTGKLVLSSSIKKKLIEKVSRDIEPVTGRGMVICPPGSHFCKKCGNITNERNVEVLCIECSKKYNASTYLEINNDSKRITNKIAKEKVRIYR